MTNNGSTYPCSNCGKYNPVDRTYCVKCRRPLR